MYFSERIVGCSRRRYTLLTARLLRVGIDWADRVGLILELTTILPSCRVSPGRRVNVSALLAFVAPPRKVDGNWKNAKSTKRSVTGCPVGTFVSRNCPARSVLALLSQGYTSTSSAFTGRPVSSTTSPVTVAVACWLSSASVLSGTTGAAGGFSAVACDGRTGSMTTSASAPTIGRVPHNFI